MAYTDLAERQRSVVDLNGDWERYIHNKLVDIVPVPSSLHPTGYYQLKKSFLLPRLSATQRVVVHFEAITYHGHVFVNGRELGTMIPYVPQEFDFTPYAREGRNNIEVAIADACPAPDGSGKVELDHCVTGGWETYGGIVRNVYVELRPEAFIDNVRFGYMLSKDYSTAACRTQVYISSKGSLSGQCELALFHGPTEVAHAKNTVQLKDGANETELTFEVKDPTLWSTADPNLYRLIATLKTAAGNDAWECRTGFRDVAIRTTQFFLNGEPIVLKGYCRHDMWKDQGFTLTKGQQEKDMRMIKASGCNFVRLVHYPHDRRIVELADEIGLLVSGEPGFWNMDLRTMGASQIELGLKIMEAMVRRDWNAPSVMLWLLGNECNFKLDYLKAGKALCNRLDPIYRPVSVAHEYGEFPGVKQMFDDAGLDFYDWHAYAYGEEKFAKVVDAFGSSKPLTFSEWGWECASGTAVFYERNFDTVLKLVEEKKLAGHMFWSWNDFPQFNRKDWSMEDFILASGAVTESREIREPIHSRLAGLFAGRPEISAALPADQATVLPLRWVPFSTGSSFQPIELQAIADSPDGLKSWAALESSLAKYWATVGMASNQWERTDKAFHLWAKPQVEIAGVTFRSPVVDGLVRPLVLTPEVAEITISIDAACSRLHILGQVTFPQGYPLDGAFGETVATYTLQYANRRVQEFPVRNGIEVAQANRIYQATRIHPVATAAQPALEFVKDPAREQYQVLLWSIPVEGQKAVRLQCKLHSGQPALGIFAITAERAAKINRGIRHRLLQTT